MSSDARLDRLGLLHLKDKPEELAAELRKRVEAQKEEEEAWHREREALRESMQQEDQPEADEKPE